MPLILWRHMLLELWRLIVLSGAVLVTVIAFAAAVKPLADGELSPGAALKFMLLAIPPMLAYALPFAASFGTTLAYHRMAQDNELIAAHAGGMPHRTILVPALVTGILMASGLAVLNEQVIPRFLRNMERMITLDLSQLLVARIERGQPATLGDMSVYADAVRRVPPEPGSGLLDQLLLVGAAAVETDREGRVITDATVERAWVILVPGPTAGFEEGSIAAVLQLERGVGVTEGELRVIERARTRPFPIPDAFQDDPKYLTFGELKALRDHPETMDFVDSRRVDLARLLAEIESVDRIGDQLRREGSYRLDGASGLGVVVQASGIKRQDKWVLTPPEGSERVIVDLYRPGPDGQPGGGGVDRLEAERVELQIDTKGESGDAGPLGPPGAARTLTCSLGLEGLYVTARSSVDGASSAVRTEQQRRSLTGLRPRVDPLGPRLDADPGTLIAEARAIAQSPRTGPGVANTINASADNLEKRIARLNREITSKQNERMAMAANCLVMVLTGAVTAMLLRHQPPLVVYLWSFFPAVITVVLISTGQNHTHSDGVVVGLPILWSGVAVLAIYAAIAFRVVSRR
ncbi:MAG: LptF/LptG family permease [Planctomycetota bacterium]